MKSFSNFLSEATQSQAALRAKKLGLVGDGHGGWIDRSGKLVARTEKGVLKFLSKSQAAADEAQKSAGSSAAPTAAAAPAQSQVPSQTKNIGDSSTDKDQEGEDESVITIVFGRFNPPTAGHEKLLRTAKSVSAGGEIRVYPSRIQDPKKNPLDPDIKVSFMKKMFPEFEENIINDSDMNSIFDVLTSVAEEGYTSVNIVVGSDRQAEIDKLAQKHNGDLYNFDLINVVAGGITDLDTQSASAVSSSKMRKAVMDNDFRAFRRGVLKKLDDAETQSLFDAVRQGMGMKKAVGVKKENYSLWQIAPKCDLDNLREQYVSGNIFNIGEKVLNLNTGLVGEIIRRGTNHLICVTEDGHMFKSWIKDLMEYNEVEMNTVNRAPGKPNTLVGTKGYLKYAIQQTPGSTLGSENLQKGGKAFLNFINKYRKKKADY